MSEPGGALEPGSALWAFALAFYGRPGVAPACLRCQDEGGADVTLLLFALWQASCGVTLEAAELTAIDRATLDWRQHVVQPLRAVRRHLKGKAAEPLRELVKAAELAAERRQLEGLAAAAPSIAGPGNRQQAARANLAAYQRATGLSLPAEAVDVLFAAFTDGKAGQTGSSQQTATS